MVERTGRLSPVIFALSAVVLASCGADSAVPPKVEAIHLNQYGFQPSSPKTAIIVTDAEAEQNWSLRNASGVVLYEGKARLFGRNAASGRTVQQIDFSSLNTPGEGYYLYVNGVKSAPFKVDKDLYRPLKYDALNFFYQQRAGVEIKPEFAGEKWARPAGHKSEKVTCYGPVDFRGNHWGGCNYTLDVTGGWYDAGDHGKYVVNGGISVWTLLNYYERSLSHVPAYEAFADGKVKIPENANGKNDLLDEARFELDFLMAMQVPEGKTLRLPLGDQRANITALKFTEVDASGMAHHKVHDEKWTPIPQRPWEDTGKRFLSYPSTTATLNLAAVTAQCARLFRGVDDAYAAKCLKVSRRAYAAAKRVPNAYAIDVINGGGGGYGDGNVVDEFYWAASELYLTTGEATYKSDIEHSPYYLSNAEFNWGSVPTLGTLSMTVARQTPAPLRKAARAKVVEAADQYLNARTGQGYHIPYNRPYRWGSNGDFANHGIMLALAHDFTGQAKYRNGTIDLMDYMLGRNPVDMSYVSGYGTRAMQHPHHRFWAHSKDKALPPPPPGVLAGGPQKGAVDTVTAKIADCEPQACYVDHIDSYTMNEVTINWNAPFFWLAAWLDDTKSLK